MSEQSASQSPKTLRWVGRSKDDLSAFPDPVKRQVGFALFFAQRGEKHGSSKPLRGFAGAGVLEVVEDQAGDTYRAVYTVRFRRAVYVLHAFKKKRQTWHRHAGPRGRTDSPSPAGSSRGLSVVDQGEPR